MGHSCCCCYVISPVGHLVRHAVGGCEQLVAVGGGEERLGGGAATNENGVLGSRDLLSTNHGSPDPARGTTAAQLRHRALGRRADGLGAHGGSRVRGGHHGGDVLHGDLIIIIISAIIIIIIMTPPVRGRIPSRSVSSRWRPRQGRGLKRQVVKSVAVN